jgi:hypothetical protein
MIRRAPPLPVLFALALSACANVPPVEDPATGRDTPDGGLPPGFGAGDAMVGGGTTPAPPRPSTPPTGPGTTPPTQPPTAPPTQPPTEGLVEGLIVRGLIAAQSLEVPIDPTRGATGVPIVAGKEVVVHALVDAAPGFMPQTVRAVLEVDGALFDDTLEVAGSSDAETFEGAFRFDLPADAVTTGTRLGLRLLALNSGPTHQVGHPASWPSSGVLAPLGAVSAGRLKVVVFPVLGVRFGARNNEVHFGNDRLAALRRAFLESYPVVESSLEIEVRPTYRFDRTVQGDCTRWDDDAQVEVRAECVAVYALLDDMIRLHAQEGADYHTVYLGLFSYDYTTHGTEGGAAGIASGTTREDLRQQTYPLGAIAHYPDEISLGTPTWQTPEDIDWYTEAVADSIGCEPERVRPFVAYQMQVDYPHQTIWHEIGHTLTLNHVDGPQQQFPPEERERNFPRPRGDIGLVGYDIGRDQRFDPYCTIDFMSYTNVPWISDFGLQRIHEVLTDPGISGGFAAIRRATPHLVALIDLAADAGATSHFGWRAARAPSSEHAGVRVLARDADDRVLDTVTARFVLFSHGQAGQLFVPEIAGAATYVAEIADHVFTLSAALPPGTE